ncbi:SNF2-related protein [Mariniplasma anaerobium]|uniref:Uncharacterized protein n=1 Tax=Mariniplasma anaerobium TaxID=2735436 RepID=A0A7U9TKX0_9MOLU|nr:SNF2-related protein [Mariniplasma anaerobium]BCR36674.1 hypothetical protein MPAN_015670 [Mariniplasma anaerobium]
MTSLKDLDLKPVYDSEKDVLEFYTSTMSVAKKYMRASAYFDDKLFAYISKGIKQLLLNNGSMQLIISSELKSKDIAKKILEGYKNKEDKKVNIDSKMLTDENIASLSFLIKIGKLDIKIAQKSFGIFHDKYGVIIDNYENTIIFSGSNNETRAALKYNHESFETTFSWDNSLNSKYKINHRINSFNRIWNNDDPEIITRDGIEFAESLLLPNLDILDIMKTINEKIIMIDILDEKKVFLKSNIDLRELFEGIRGSVFKPIIELNLEYVIEFKTGISFDEIEKIIKFIENKKKNYKFNLIYSNRIENYLDSMKLDMNKISKEGQRILDKNFTNSEEFIQIRNTLNNYLKRSLRDPQVISAYHLINLKRTMNFSVPGSGKTASIISAFNYLRFIKKPILSRILVIGPINCFKSWKDEYKILNQDYEKFQVYDSCDDTSYDKATILENDFYKFKLILLNYESLPHISNMLSKLIDSSTMIVFDEIHRIKRIEGIYFRACRNIVDNSIYRVALTGTPLPNGYMDIHNLFDILYGSYARTYFGFTTDILKDSQEKYKKTNLENKDINTIIKPFYVRVSKKDLDIPAPEKDKLVSVITTLDEKKLYNDIYFGKSYKSLSKIVKMMLLGSIGSRALDSDIQDESDFYNGVENSDESNINLQLTTNKAIFSSKILKTVEIAESLLENNRSVIIWAVFKKTIHELKTVFDSKNLKSEFIYGITSNDERNRIIDEFNSGTLKILIANASTLAESVSLHKACHDAIYVELNFNLSQYLQSRDRIHRLGIDANQKTNYYILFNKYDVPSIDEKIYLALKEKERLMYQAIERNELFAQSNATVDEIIEQIEIEEA